MIPGDRFKHCKGNDYIVLDVLSYNNEELVVYYNPSILNKVWLRPVKMFAENHSSGKKRFTFLENNSSTILEFLGMLGQYENMKVVRAEHTETAEIYFIDLLARQIAKL